MAAIAADVDIERSLRSSATGTTRLAADGDGRVPVIDLSQPDAAEAMWAAATTVGFFTVTNHGVPDELIENAFASSKQFFARDLDAKQRESPFAPQLNSGFEYFSQVRPSTGTADQKESLQITARAGAMDGRWPAEPEALQPVARAMMEASQSLAARILDMLEPRACPNLAPGTLQKSHTLWGPGGQCTLRLLNYPPTAPPEVDSNLWRAGPHTDWCCVTLLYQLPGHEGLECAANPRAGAGQSGWLKVDPVAGGVAVNIGDMLSRWAVWKSNNAGMEATSRRWRGNSTPSSRRSYGDNIASMAWAARNLIPHRRWADGRVLSNLHRVRMPTGPECGRPRQSIAFFMQADKEALIESSGETITAGDYILGRIRSNFAAKFGDK